MAPSYRSNSPRKLYVQLAVVLILVAFALLKPRIQPWLDQNVPALADNGVRLPELDDAESADNIVPTVVTRSERLEQSERTSAVVPGVQKTDSGTPDPRPSQAASPEEAVPDRRTGASDSRESGDEPPPGQLKLIGKNVFRSTAGLVYRPGSRDGHRLKHILKHAKDDLQKPVHGVFEGDRDTILRWIDVAWMRAGKGGKLVRKRRQNDRTAWTVNMEERIGFTGGRKGQSGRQSACRYLRLVVEDDGETVVTAYPVSSF